MVAVSSFLSWACRCWMTRGSPCMGCSRWVLIVPEPDWAIKATRDARRRLAHEVIEGPQGRFRAIARRHDDLLERRWWHRPAAKTPGTEVAPRASTMISPCRESSTVPRSHSVLGTRPICTNTPSSRARRLAPAPAVLVERAHRPARPSPVISVVCAFTTVATFGRLRQLVLQHRVRAQLRVELDQGHVGCDACEVDRRLDAGIAAADHRDALALEQRSVAMGAVGHALVAVFLLAGNA